MAIGKRKESTEVKKKDGSMNKRVKVAKLPKKVDSFSPKKKKNTTSSGSSESDSMSQNDKKKDSSLNESEDEDFAGFGESASENDELESAESEAENDEESSSQKSNSKESHAQRKKLQKERKAMKPFADTSLKAKSLWDKLRQKTSIKAEERKTIIAELFDLIRTNVKQLVFKHDMSRVVQTCVKFGSKQQRETICAELAGSYVDLCKSPYGKYLAIKIFKYGTPKMKEVILGEMYGNVVKMIRHREAAYVVEDAFREFTNLQQQRALICEFYGPEFQVFKDRTQDIHIDKLLIDHPEKRPSIMQNLWKTIEGSIAKGSIGFTMVHRAMLEFINHADSNEAKELLNLTKELIYEFVHTRDGSQVAMKLFALANAKDRKVMLKSLRPYLIETAKDSYGHLVVVAALDCTDDTIMTGKLLQAEFEGELLKLSADKFARRILLYVLVGWEDARYFSKENRELLRSLDSLKAKTSKKDPIVRRNELKATIGPLLISLISKAAGDMIAESLASQVLVDALLYAPCEKEEAVDATLKAFDGNPEQDNHLIHQIHCSRALKTLVQNGHWSGAEKQVVKAEDDLKVASKLIVIIKKYLVEWASGDGAFVVVAVLEALSDSEKQEFLKILRKHKNQLNKSEFRGTKKLLEML
ncbi:pumilio family RNA-binding protein Puf6 [Schizosaccharomyces pombe]|uniref:Pumilio homology domain family member 6 n=1 Tax=Schizosaccharomyces pombe (strain 972 / ATCC 24843) TaxID=284812 RepID=PUF6_SCHPO|nr:putative Puf family RNA-binding protein Puf6 [Schizosaccharomyces pombe]Q9UU76.1 RecName: Full=Pumilio homology domain family member 6 [Schizosaccharomyces pombe 972h-]CAB54870.1 Puf family RNA-binding protein Puf6 (predicted) [Schizosaccharomyces pombe]|eukprot:NP_588564.1 putative Puf family RNA-binding protein Puf6 [Schizosaccharomyces pombe]